MEGVAWNSEELSIEWPTFGSITLSTKDLSTKDLK
jgi:dTDP-4-dehydrorhamnose 3,5-epimerase-like enzyme